MEEAVRQLAAMADEMHGGDVRKLLEQVNKDLLVSALIHISGYSPEAFRAGFRHVDRFELHSFHEQRLQAVREGSPAVQDGPYAYIHRDGYMAGEGLG